MKLTQGRRSVPLKSLRATYRQRQSPKELRTSFLASTKYRKSLAIMLSSGLPVIVHYSRSRFSGVFTAYFVKGENYFGEIRSLGEVPKSIFDSLRS